MALNARYRTRITKLHKKANVPTMNEFITKLSESFYKRCSYSENNLIKRLGVTKLDTSKKIKHRFPQRN
jgi:hypothetical protein